MLQSKLFSKVERAAPKDELSLNARLLIRGGFVYKNSAGIFSYLPLGWRVIQKITKIIREEMNAIGGQELCMPALVEKKYLETTGRWNVNIGYKVVASNQRFDRPELTVEGQPATSNQFALGWTHEEMMAEIAARYVGSYKDLPFAAYQIQTKFRNEPRAKSGLLRGREFMMKDLYSFHVSEADLMDYYAKVGNAYRKIFDRCGLQAIYTLAAGGDFTASNTHEFQVMTPVGEDTIYVCDKCAYAENDEISKLKDGGACPKCPSTGSGQAGKVSAKKSIEIGNIFPLGTKYAEAFNLKFKDETGKENFVVMGSYGIGLGRVMATVVEIHNDTNGIIWPEPIAPFAAHLLVLGDGADVRSRAGDLYNYLQTEGVEVLYDDRTLSPGRKFAEADLLGIPFRLVVSEKTGEKVEVKKRDESGEKLMSREALFKILNPKS